MDFAGNFPSFFFFFFGVQSDPATFNIFKSGNSYSFHNLGFYAGNLFYHWIVFITNWLLTLTLICLKTRLIKLLPMKIVSKAMQRDNAYILKNVNTDFELARKSVFNVKRILSHLAIYYTKIVYIQINIYNSDYIVSNTVNYFMPDRLPILNYNLSLWKNISYYNLHVLK